jgi:hypothetical protein
MMLDGFDSEHMKQAVRRSRMAHNRGPQEEEEWKPALSEQAPQLTAVAAAASGPGGWPGTAHSSSSIRAGRAGQSQHTASASGPGGWPVTAHSSSIRAGRLARHSTQQQHQGREG